MFVIFMYTPCVHGLLLFFINEMLIYQKKKKKRDEQNFLYAASVGAIYSISGKKFTNISDCQEDFIRG